MNRLHILTVTAGMLALPLSAQTRSWRLDAGGALLYATPALDKVTHSKMAYAIEGGFGFTLPNGLPTRISINHYEMPGKDFGTIKSSLKLNQIAWDLYLDSSLKSWVFKAGLSGNRYSVDNSGTETWVADGHNASARYPQSVWAVTSSAARGWKLGIRAGVEYRWTARLTADLLFQATELSGGERRPGTSYPNDGGVNPTWIQLGLRYTF